MDIAGDFRLANQVKAYYLISVCSWSSAALFAPLRLKPLSRMPATLDSLLTLPLSMLSFLLNNVFLKVSLLPILLNPRLNRLSF